MDLLLAVKTQGKRKQQLCADFNARNSEKPGVAVQQLLFLKHRDAYKAVSLAVQDHTKYRLEPTGATKKALQASCSFQPLLTTTVIALLCFLRGGLPKTRSVRASVSVEKAQRETCRARGAPTGPAEASQEVHDSAKRGLRAQCHQKRDHITQAPYVTIRPQFPPFGPASRHLATLALSTRGSVVGTAVYWRRRRWFRGRVLLSPS